MIIKYSDGNVKSVLGELTEQEKQELAGLHSKSQNNDSPDEIIKEAKNGEINTPFWASK